MSANNAKQADVIDGAAVLTELQRHCPRPISQRPVRGAGAIVILLPGPPHEMKGVFENEVRDRLRAKVPPAAIFHPHSEDRHAGRVRSDARVAPIYKKYPDVETTILAGAGEIELHFKKSPPLWTPPNPAPTKSPEWSRTSSTTPSTPVTVNRSSNRQLLASDAQFHGRHRGVLHGRPACRTHYFNRRQLALLSWRGDRLLEPAENRIRRSPRRI